jgi:hypothetical protein
LHLLAAPSSFAMPNFKLSAALWLLAAWSARALDFTWGFNQAGANTLAQCGSVELGFYSADATPTPPFFAYTYPGQLSHLDLAGFDRPESRF